MEIFIFIINIINFSITILSLIVFLYLLYHYFKDKDKKYATHSLIRLLYILAFFIFIDSLYNSFVFLSQFGFINQKIFFVLNTINFKVLPKIGIFLSNVFLIHFIMEKRIDLFKSNEDKLKELKEFNLELEKKLIENKKTQEILEKKALELERYNEIAKEREQKMLKLMKKIEKLEEGIK